MTPGQGDLMKVIWAIWGGFGQFWAFFLAEMKGSSFWPRLNLLTPDIAPGSIAKVFSI